MMIESRGLKISLSLSLSYRQHLVLADLVADGFHRTFYDDQHISVVHGNDLVYAFECPPYKGDNREAYSQVNPAGNKELLLVLVVNKCGQTHFGRRYIQMFEMRGRERDQKNRRECPMWYLFFSALVCLILWYDQTMRQAQCFEPAQVPHFQTHPVYSACSQSHTHTHLNWCQCDSGWPVSPLNQLAVSACGVVGPQWLLT